MTSFDLNSLIWSTIPEEEKKAFILLSVPIWFDEELGKKLLTAFSVGPTFLVARVTRYHHIVYRYEEESWHIADGLRTFLLEKTEEFNLELPSVHVLLIEHYRAAVQTATRFRKQEYIYLRLYHQVQTDVRAGLRAVFREYLTLEEQDRLLRLPSLVRLCETIPVKVDTETEYRLLKIRNRLLHTPCGKVELEEFRDELKGIAHDAEEAVLAEEADRLLLPVLEQLPASKPNRKLRKKTEKRLDQKNAAFCLLEKPEQEAGNTGTSAFFAEHVQKIVAQIVHMHRQGLHQEAWEQATGYLVSVQENQKSYLCKSYCKIASSITEISDSVEWQIQYFDLATKANQFDPVALNGKAELLARLGRTDEALQLFDKAHQIQPNNVVALNGKANLLTKIGRLAEAIELYQSIPASIADQYTRCGLAFLLLKTNSGEEDIAAARRLFAEAEKIEPLNMLVLLGLWISHARLGNAEQMELFRRRFEDCQAAQERCNVFLLAEEIAQKEAEQQLEEIKCLITVWEMAFQAQYQRVVDRVVPYALLHLSAQQRRAFSFC